MSMVILVKKSEEVPQHPVCNSIQHISQPDCSLFWDKLWPVVSAGAEPGGHVDGVGGGKLEVGHAWVQVDGEGIKEHLLGVLPELKHRRQDRILSPWSCLGWVGSIVGCAGSHSRTPGLVSRKGRCAATMSAKAALAGSPLYPSPLSSHCTWIDEPPDRASEPEHGAMLQDGRLHRPLPVDHHLGPGVAGGDGDNSLGVCKDAVSRKKTS